MGESTARLRALHVAPLTLYVLTSTGALALFSSWTKPLLYDEYVYFALGGLSSTGDAFTAVWQTTTNLNQGVTGAFMLSDFWLLQAFGANTAALRFPGLLTGALLLIYAAIFLVNRRVSMWSLPSIPVVFVTQELVLRYVGEARTYMPLAAAVIGVLAYYSLDRNSRCTWWGRTTGWSAVLLGVLFHPYFVVYWFAIVCMGLLLWRRENPRWSILSYLNMRLAIVGGVLFVAIGALTWMRGKAIADVDPFNFLPGPLPIEIVAQNVYFLAQSPWAISGAAFALGIPVVLAISQRVPVRTILEASVQPLVLIAVALSLALAISASTILNDFWIFPRQWIASTALVALGAVWLVAQWWQVTSTHHTNRPSHVRTAAFAISVVAILVMVIPSVRAQRVVIDEWSDRPRATESSQAELRSRLDSGEVLSDPEWISYAQTNIDLGGEVWPEFGRYYTDIDWTAFVLTDGSRPQAPESGASTQ